MQRRVSGATRVFAAAVLAAAMAVGVSGCSPGADYPSLFPAIHDMPPPRAETTMDPDQVQQATEDLITERNHLSSETQGGGQAKDATAANPAVKKSQPAAAASKASGPGRSIPGSAASATQTAGAETK